MNQSTATASTVPVPVSSHALPGTDVPSDFRQMMELAEALAEAEDFLPEPLRGKPGNVLAIMLRARALDIPLAVAWDELYVTKGRVGQTAKLVRALARRAGHRIAYVEYDRFHAVALIQCRGESAVHEVRFTIQEAKAMGLTEPSPYTGKGGEQWHRQPENMLIARVTTRAVNRYCPEVMLGLGNELREAELDNDPLDGVASDTIIAHQEHTRLKVTRVLRAAEEVDRDLEADGEVRLCALRELFIDARENQVLDYSADDTGEYSVRQVLTEKMMSADRTAKAQADGDQPLPPRPDGATPVELAAAALERIWKTIGVIDGELGTPEPEQRPTDDPPVKKTASKPPAKKATAKKAAPAKAPRKTTKKTTRAKAPTRPAEDTAPASPDPAPDAPRADPQQDTGAPPAPQPPASPAARPGVSARPDDRKLPCGCVVDHVISTGQHADDCQEGR